MGKTIVFAIILLLLGGLILFSIIASILYLLKIPKRSLKEAREIEHQSKENRAAIGGLLLGNVFLLIIYQAVFAGVAPNQVIISIIAGVNAFFLFFILCRYIATRLARNRIKQIEMYGDENE